MQEVEENYINTVAAEGPTHQIWGIMSVQCEYTTESGREFKITWVPLIIIVLWEEYSHSFTSSLVLIQFLRQVSGFTLCASCLALGWKRTVSLSELVCWIQLPAGEQVDESPEAASLSKCTRKPKLSKLIKEAKNLHSWWYSVFVCLLLWETH